MNQEEIMQQLQAAVALHNQGELDQAEAIYRQVLAVDENNFYALNFCGCIQREKKRFDDAITLLSSAVSAQPGNPDANYNLGNVFKDAERWDEAISCYEKTLDLKAEYPEALNNLGICLKETEQYEHSEIVLKRAISRQPRFAAAWLNLGNTLKEQKKYSEAIVSYRNAIEVKPDFAEAYLNLGNVLKEEGEVEEAIVSYRKAIEVKPDCAGAYFSLGLVLKGEGEVEEAIVSYRNAIEVKPDFAEAYLNLGYVLKEEGDVEEAIASYRKAIEVKPDFVKAFLGLGAVLTEKGEIDDARQVVSALFEMIAIEESYMLPFPSSNLVFEWHHRLALHLSWELEFAALSGSSVPFSAFEAEKKVDAQHFPPLFLKGEGDRASKQRLYRNGYLVEDQILSENLCAEFVNEFEGVRMMTAGLIRAVSEKGVLGSVLDKIFKHTGFPHFVWDCFCFAKGPDTESVSDAWHYDNHYNIWTPKLMVYLNSQREEAGATQFVDATLSQRISEKSDYMGLVCQRKYYTEYVKALEGELRLDPVTFDPPHYTFCPDRAGTGVWFCPARVLHRGVSPKKGLRYVLTFSLTPLPRDCQWSMEQCVEKSVEILRDKIKQGMTEIDINPFWSVSNRSV
ncbi:tetratricopeptide repeat protein [Prochlorococcus marinus]|uniref:Uncharacterized protein n=1 Tax=Prochlorococcus marinus (strain MIT 9303) TaxID=59922 RepID=A2CCD0_PROM3|nr:tetratricopeptide repeat protein [Prochlorococcus marinus]ABM79140.1 Hypothetical protein P9303_24071 [Prochlorococcus marinus str. MIT 9303]